MKVNATRKTNPAARHFRELIPRQRARSAVSIGGLCQSRRLESENGSKPLAYFNVALRVSSIVVADSNVSFPLTRSLSLGEREKCSAPSKPIDIRCCSSRPRTSKASSGRRTSNSRTAKQRRRPFPLPGERVRVRGNEPIASPADSGMKETLKSFLRHRPRLRELHFVRALIHGMINRADSFCKFAPNKHHREI